LPELRIQFDSSSGDRRREVDLGIRPLVVILPDRTQPTLLDIRAGGANPQPPNQQRPLRTVPLHQVRPPMHEGRVVDSIMRLLSPQPVEEMAAQARTSPRAAPVRGPSAGRCHHGGAAT
jgi:hypothetical protein